MSNTPVYNAQGGGRLYWKVTSANGDYSGQLASISGLTKRVDYNGGLYFQDATIQIAGGGLFAGDDIGSALNIYLVDNGGNVLTGWGDYTITALESVGPSVKITCRPIKAQQIPEDYNWYEFKPWQPRRYAQYWLNAAMQGVDTVASIPLHTGTKYARADAKVVAPASVFKGCSGLRGPKGSDTCTTQIQLGNEQSESTWTTTPRTTQLPPAFDAEFDFAPKFGALISSTPLYWHYIGSGGNSGYFVAAALARITDSGASPNDKCQFPLGIVQYLKVGLIWYGSSSNVALYRNVPVITPGNEQEIVLEFQTRKEAKQYLAESAKYRPRATPMSPFGKSTRHGITADGAVMYRGYKKGGKTVTIYGIKYTATAASFYNHARSALASSATKPSEATPGGDDIEQDGIVYSTSSGLMFPTPTGVFVANMHFLPQEANSDWAALGLSGINSFVPAYKWQQTVYPVTIAQDYTTREHYAEACMFGHIGFFQNATGLVGAELCAESGTVYALPINTHTAVGVEAGQLYTTPKEIWINFRDQYGINRSYQFTDPQHWVRGTGEAMTCNLCGGVIQPASPTLSGTTAYISLNANAWNAQPGCMAVRLHGSDWSTASGINVLASSAPPQIAQLQGEKTFYTLDSPNYSSLVTINNYGVRTPDGTTWRPFVGNMRMNISYLQANDFAKEQAPLVDVFTITTWAEANSRVYLDNIDHQSYIVQTTMAFISAEPGDVVAVELPQIFDGAPLLATVLAVEADSNGTCKLEVVPMHKITSDDYNAYTNLAQVLP